MQTPEVIVLTRDGWWYKSHEDANGWWWLEIGGVRVSRYSNLPEIVETYQPSSVIHELVRSADV